MVCVDDGLTHEEDDEVIGTYNVYASSFVQQQQQLHIFQFPLRSKARPYEANEVRLFATGGSTAVDEGMTPCSPMKPPGVRQENSGTTGVIHPSSRLTMHCHIDTFGSSSFAELQQNQHADGNTGYKAGEKRYAYSYALQSHPFLPRCDYMVGTIIDGALHITPVTSIQQFTPIVKPLNGSSVHRVSSDFVSVPVMPIVPGLALSDRVTRELLRQRSVMLNNDADSAKELQFFPIQSVESMAMRRRLWAHTAASFGAGEPGELVVTGRAEGHNQHVRHGSYVDSAAEDCFFPPELLVSGGITGGEDAASDDRMLRRYANRRTVAYQVNLYLRRCQVLTLEKLRELVVPFEKASSSTSLASQPKTEGTVPDKQLISALRNGAVWMHGVWVSKVSPNLRGNAAALREVILLLFYESPDGALSRSRLNALVSSNALKRTVKEILEGISTLNSEEKDPSRRVWRLRLVPADPAARAALVEASLTAFGHEVAFQRQQYEKLSSSIMGHLDAVNAGRLVTRLLFTMRPEDAGSEATSGSANSPAAANFNENDLAPIVSFIRKLFLEHGVLNKQRAKEMVLKGRQQHYPEATNAMLSAALQQCVQPFTGATWVLKTLGEPLVDEHRPLILETALELVNFEIRAFNALLTQKRQRKSDTDGTSVELGAVAKDDMQKIVSRVLAEVADYKAHERLWHLKSGNVIN
uniref:DNA-directed RNA polymerase III subunit RPC5 n=1 Tax=Trypanosoma congolense (strain IL3000) TaxID=1068625 RepID=G0UZX3_TRYCI|nr:conserved hypothetical protein [Trypanosoma congolense IL3000]